MNKKLLIGIGLGIVLVYFSVRGIDFQETLSHLKKIHLGYAALSLFCIVLMQALRSYRWGVILEPLEKLRNVAINVRHHHERFDGRGYPNGLKGDAIPLPSRMIAILDTYDAMTTARPYRGPLPKEKAAEEIKRNLGTQFDPDIGKTFLDLFYTGSIG